jgi:transposase InsO family protein
VPGCVPAAPLSSASCSPASPASRPAKDPATPRRNARILAFKYRYRLSHELLARWFLLDPGTLSAWNRDADHAERRSRPLVEPLPDLDTAIRIVASTLRHVPNRLKEAVAQTLTALAHKVPPRRAWKPRRRRERAHSSDARRTTRPPLVPKRPSHFWGSDLTTIELRFKFYLGAIVDLYSRDILAWRLFHNQPSSAEMAALFGQAAAQHGKPEHFVSDQGGQFVGEPLRAALERLGVESRHGAVGQKGSIAIVERMWRSLKEHLDLRGARSEIAAALELRIAAILDYYGTKRPHAALANATPRQVFSGEPAPAHNLKPAPRGRAGDNALPAPFLIRHVFPLDQSLPYLERIA